jgi:hypothetical protein
MSWSVSLQHVLPDEIESEARVVFDKQKSHLNEAPDEMEGDFELACELAVQLAERLSSGGTVNVSLYGHANRGRKPPSGWASDSIAVSVSLPTVEVQANG